jgi:4-diphosphocytidyl-2-C-methyl-D-erythritol kinase
MAKRSDIEMPGLQQIALRSYAKINLGLQVVRKRGDGFHEIRTVFQTIELHDRLQIRLVSGRHIEFESDHTALHPIDNLVVKAISALNSSLRLKQGCRVQLEKRIPLGSGLGGGSSNAAAAILGMKKLLNLDIPTRQLFEMGGLLGSDVPFFFVGGTALGVGRGSEIYPLADHALNHILLVVPSAGVSTKLAYTRMRLPLTKQGGKSMIPVFCSAYVDSLNGNKFLENDFEKVVFRDFPGLKQIRRELLKLGALAAGLTGSGSALFGLFDSKSRMLKARNGVASDDFQFIETKTLQRQQYWNCLVESLE